MRTNDVEVKIQSPPTEMGDELVMAAVKTRPSGYIYLQAFSSHVFFPRVIENIENSFDGVLFFIISEDYSRFEDASELCASHFNT